MHMHWVNIDGEKFTYFPCEIAFTDFCQFDREFINQAVTWSWHCIFHYSTFDSKHQMMRKQFQRHTHAKTLRQQKKDTQPHPPPLFLHWKIERETTTSAFVFISLQISIECLNSLFSFDTSNKRFNLLRKFFRIFARVLRAHILFMNEMRSQSRSTESS